MIGKLGKWGSYAAALLRARTVAQRLTGGRAITRVLSVCYGNIYRSPFAAACLRAQIPVGAGLSVRSAGFHERDGRAVEPGFQRLALERYGIDLAAHRSRTLSADDLDWADLVLIMDGHNYRLMHDRHRRQLGKCIWLGAVCDETPIVIRDPYGTDQNVQAAIADQLFRATQALGARITATAAGP